MRYSEVDSLDYCLIFMEIEGFRKRFTDSKVKTSDLKKILIRKLRYNTILYLESESNF